MPVARTIHVPVGAEECVHRNASLGHGVSYCLHPSLPADEGYLCCADNCPIIKKNKEIEEKQNA